MTLCPNGVLSSVLVETLFQEGVRNVCIAPGSRSTPLVMAVATHEGFQTHVYVDERALCFFALGLVQANNQPVAIITTSGTAVANLLPAVIEAYYFHAPLILLTADRPKEKLGIGENQTIIQEGLFQTYCAATLYLSAPDSSFDAALFSENLRSVLEKGSALRAPVHINIPFREPLYVPTSL